MSIRSAYLTWRALPHSQGTPDLPVTSGVFPVLSAPPAQLASWLSVTHQLSIFRMSSCFPETCSQVTGILERSQAQFELLGTHPQIIMYEIDADWIMVPRSIAHWCDPSWSVTLAVSRTFIEVKESIAAVLPFIKNVGPDQIYGAIATNRDQVGLVLVHHEAADHDVVRGICDDDMMANVPFLLKSKFNLNYQH